MFALIIEAARINETSVNFYETTFRNNPEDVHIHYLEYLIQNATQMWQNLTWLKQISMYVPDPFYRFYKKMVYCNFLTAT
jgi:hypothetical protein